MTNPRGSAAALAVLGIVAASTGCEGGCGRKPPAAPAASGFAGDSRRLVVIPDGQEMADGAFSPDGRHVAFITTSGGRTYVFLDGERSGPYDGARDLTFLGAGRGAAFVAQVNGKERVVAGGVEGALFAAIGKLLAAPDGTLAYSARRDGGWSVVSGNRSAAVPGDADPSPWLSGDGKRVAWVEQRAAPAQSHLRVCALDFGTCSSVGAWDAIGETWPDGSSPRVALVASRGGREAVVRLDLSGAGPEVEPHRWYDAVPLVALSGGGDRLAFLARKGDQQLLVVGEAETPLPPSESPLDLVVARSGRTLLTVVAQEKVLILADGRRVAGEFQGAHFPVASADGAHLAVVVETATGDALMVDGVQGPIFDKVVTPRFSPDGTRLAYRARKDGRRFVVVADAAGKVLREQAPYDAVFDVQFSPNGKAVGYGVRSGRELWWKVEPL